MRRCQVGWQYPREKYQVRDRIRDVQVYGNSRFPDSQFVLSAESTTFLTEFAQSAVLTMARKSLRRTKPKLSTY